MARRGMVERISYCVEKSILDTIKEFKLNPYIFYSARDAHCYLYCCLLKNKIFKDNYTIKEDMKTSIVHTEYPTIHQPNKKRRREAYDIVIFNPNNLKNIIPKQPHGVLREEDDAPTAPLFAIEIGFNDSVEHLENDLNELENKKNKVKNGIIIHFIRNRRVIRNEFRGLKPMLERINKSDNVIVYCVIYFTKHQKKDTNVDAGWLEFKDGRWKYSDSRLKKLIGKFERIQKIERL